MPDTITAAHDPSIPADEIDDIRRDLQTDTCTRGALRRLLLQALDDLEGAYARISVAYRRLNEENERIKTLRAELDAIGNLAYRGGDRETLTDALAAIHTRAKAAARMDPQT